MQIPQDLQYTKTHEWVKFNEDGSKAKVGITDFAQNQMGDIVFITLPEVGDSVAAEDTLTDFESVKAVSDIYSPVSGDICAVNEDLADAPELLNSDPYAAWIVELENLGETAELLSAAAYQAYCQEQEEA
ncbi:MAG: glycine cleavage system protein GcvH [Firmicutes bacterium]|nr:glycine cleavage system protein GcvH [Bacillota bacterium]